MQPGSPSRTALAAAMHRATHQVVEQGYIFADPLAVRIVLGNVPEPRPDQRRMRLFIALRTRFAEDALAAAVARGTRQLVVLGAGLDTFAYRNPYGGLRVFEVDHPATQAWKRERLAQAAIAIPASLTFAPIDFESQTLDAGLAAAGFDTSLPTFFTWLGVVPYLTEDAVWATLTYIARLSAASHVVFDYSDPPESFGPELRAQHELRAARVRELGEPWLTFFDPLTLHAKLRALGFTEIEDRAPSSEKGGHVIRATLQPA